MLILLRNILREYVKLHPIILIKINETLPLVGNWGLGIGDWGLGISCLFLLILCPMPHALCPLPHIPYLTCRIQSIANQ
jgi:hypothetical protein